MSNFTHYNNDPLFSAAAAILEGKSITPETDLEEGVEEIKAKAMKLKVGDKTNFGTVKKMDSSSITFKTKDVPETRITFNQRKMGSKEFVLDRLGKIEEGVENKTISEAVALATNTLKGQIVNLLALTSVVRVSHWRASTKTNEHAALGDLYGSLSDLLDSFIEIEMGISRSRTFVPASYTIDTNVTIPTLITELRARAEALVNTSKALGAEDLINTSAEILAAVNKAAYLLEV